MIAVGDIIIGLGLAVVRAEFNMIYTAAGIDHGNPLLGQIEMVGTVIIALFHVRVRSQHPPLGYRRPLKIGIHFRQAKPGNNDIPGHANQIEAVHVEPGNGFVERKEGIFTVVFRPQQALLLGGRGQENHGPFGRCLQRAKGLGQFQKRRDAGGIVERAVIDIVAAVIGLTYPQVIPVGHVEEILIRLFGPRDNPDHVPGTRMVNLIGKG